MNLCLASELNLGNQFYQQWWTEQNKVSLKGISIANAFCALKLCSGNRSFLVHCHFLRHQFFSGGWGGCEWVCGGGGAVGVGVRSRGTNYHLSSGGRTTFFIHLTELDKRGRAINGYIGAWQMMCVFSIRTKLYEWRVWKRPPSPRSLMSRRRPRGSPGRATAACSHTYLLKPHRFDEMMVFSEALYSINLFYLWFIHNHRWTHDGWIRLIWFNICWISGFVSVTCIKNFRSEIASCAFGQPL